MKKRRLLSAGLLAAVCLGIVYAAVPYVSSEKAGEDGGRFARFGEESDASSAGVEEEVQLVVSPTSAVQRGVLVGKTGTFPFDIRPQGRLSLVSVGLQDVETDEVVLRHECPLNRTLPEKGCSAHLVFTPKTAPENVRGLLKIVWKDETKPSSQDPEVFSAPFLFSSAGSEEELLKEALMEADQDGAGI